MLKKRIQNSVKVSVEETKTALKVKDFGGQKNVYNVTYGEEVPTNSKEFWSIKTQELAGFCKSKGRPPDLLITLTQNDFWLEIVALMKEGIHWRVANEDKTKTDCLSLEGSPLSGNYSCTSRIPYTRTGRTGRLLDESKAPETWRSLHPHADLVQGRNCIQECGNCGDAPL